MIAKSYKENLHVPYQNSPLVQDREGERHKDEAMNSQLLSCVSEELFQFINLHLMSFML